MVSYLNPSAQDIYKGLCLCEKETGKRMYSLVQNQRSM